MDCEEKKPLLFHDQRGSCFVMGLANEPVWERSRAQKRAFAQGVGATVLKPSFCCCVRMSEQDDPEFLRRRHPAYAALNHAECLTMISNLYECLHEAEWRTCVVCWRAWYDFPYGYNFHKLVLGRTSSEVPWFELDTSEVLGKIKQKSVSRWCLTGAASACVA